jgi:hypothetical protein
LGDTELRGTHAETVTDLDISLKDPFSREVLAERSPPQLHPWKLSSPVFIVLGGIGVHSLLGTTVYGEVGLPVAVEVEPVSSNFAFHRRLPY